MVFKELYAKEYDSLYGTKSYSSECDLIEDAFEAYAAKPARVLDVGCGTGGHVLELARRGYDCSGVDLSGEMLSIARQKAAVGNFPHVPSWHEGNATNFDLRTSFDAAVMMFAVVGYLTTNDDVLAGLSNIRRHLKPGALFLCDFWYGPAVLSVRPEDRVKLVDGAGRQTLRAASTALDTFHQTADVSFRLWTIEGDRYLGETTEVHKMRYFFPQEFRLLLGQSGFESLSLSEFPHLGRPLTDESWNALSVARAI